MLNTCELVLKVYQHSILFFLTLAPHMAAKSFALLFIVFTAGFLRETYNAPYCYIRRDYFVYFKVSVRNALPCKLKISKFPFGPICILALLHKRGHVNLFCPFPLDLTIFMDVEWNPGPDTALSGLSWNFWNQNYNILASGTLECSSSGLQNENANMAYNSRPIVYSRNELFNLRSSISISVYIYF